VNWSQCYGDLGDEEHHRTDHHNEVEIFGDSPDPDTYKCMSKRQDSSLTCGECLVQVDTAVRVDAQLQVGAVTQTVEVTGEVPQLKTDRADVSLDFNSDYVEKRLL